MNAVEAEGTTLEEAIASALRQLQVERDRVEIEVIAQPTKGFLGIGGKKARVRASLRVPLSARASEPRTETPRSSPRPPEQKTAPQPLPTQKAEAASEAGSRTHTPLSPEIAEKACSTLKEVLGLMGTTSTLKVENRGDESVINVTHVTDLPEGFLIGHRGQTLDALEYLVNRIVTKSDDIDAHVAVDVEGYRERRRKSLENLALRLGERAKRRRKSVTLSPMSPRDRRVIHLTLEGDPLVTTKSSGHGYFRQVSIVPEEGQRKERSRSAGRPQTAES
ncbi:MAG: KH domain-containing protein [Deltaproteobacteria bacterium]|nr:KH domain-containing protein [Deltaproteobacteria bacterium]